MTLAITFMMYLTVIGRFFVSATAGSLAFLTIIALSPRYFGIGIGEGGFALSVQRMISITLISLIILALIFQRKKSRNYESIYSPNFFLYVFLLFFSISAFSSFKNNPNSIYFIFIFSEDLINIFLSYLIVFFVFPIYQSKTKFLKYLFLIPAAVSSLFIFIELLNSEPVFSDIEDTSIAALRDPGEAKFRDGAYRAKALFNGPLILSEFAVYAWVSVLFLWGVVERNVKRPKREISQQVLILFGIIVLFCVLSTGSRAGLALVVIATFCFLIIQNTRRTGRKLSAIAIRFYIVIGISLVLAYLYYKISQFIQVKSFSDIANQFDRSSYARTLQYFQVASIIQDSPLIGFGYQRNFAERFDALYNIDNHYLRVLLQAGFLGLALFIIAIFTVILSGLRMLSSDNREVSRIGAFLIVFGVVFLIQKLFLSQPDNNIYLYLVYFISIREANLALLSHPSASVQPTKRTISSSSVDAS